jgi:hypothetical protein
LAVDAKDLNQLNRVYLSHGYGSKKDKQTILAMVIHSMKINAEHH